jgi:O-acetyl-ADP-ribose deacetylase (regulator of RNase III)
LNSWYAASRCPTTQPDTGGNPRPESRMNLHLVDTNPALVAAWRSAFADLPEVSIQQGSILPIAYNTIVSPAYSYGFMNGGIDLAYRWFFPKGLEVRVHQAISARPEHFLPVGESLVVPTCHQRSPAKTAISPCRPSFVRRPRMRKSAKRSSAPAWARAPALSRRQTRHERWRGHIATGPISEKFGNDPGENADRWPTTKLTNWRAGPRLRLCSQPCPSGSRYSCCSFASR